MVEANRTRDLAGGRRQRALGLFRLGTLVAIATTSLRSGPVGAAIPAGSAAAADPEALASPDAATVQSWIEASDRIRNLPGSFALRNTLVEFRGGREVERGVITLYARPARSGGQFDNLVQFDQPARDAGKLMLRNGLDLWFYDPATRASIRISPQQRLLGQASNGDVMTTRLAGDYDATFVGRETVSDGEKRRRETVRFDLRARRPDLAYPRLDYWLDAGDRRPVMARYRSVEGRLIKTAYFRRYQSVQGVERPTETVIIDALNPSWVTLMQQDAHRLRDVPPEWMQREFLPRFRPD